MLARHVWCPAGIGSGACIVEHVNMFYDCVLRLSVREGVKLIAIADKVAVVAVALNAELIEQLFNPRLEEIASWVSSNGL